MHETLNWASEPAYVRVFLLVLVIVAGIFIVRLLNLVRRLVGIGHQAESRSQYLWELCDADVKSIKGMAVLTTLLSLVVLTHGAFPTWSYEFNNSKITGDMALIYAGEELLARLTLGLLLSAILYGASSFLEGVMLRRRAYWKYNNGKEEK